MIERWLCMISKDLKVKSYLLLRKILIKFYARIFCCVWGTISFHAMPEIYFICQISEWRKSCRNKLHDTEWEFTPQEATEEANWMYCPHLVGRVYQFTVVDEEQKFRFRDLLKNAVVFTQIRINKFINTWKSGYLQPTVAAVQKHV